MVNARILANPATKIRHGVAFGGRPALRFKQKSAANGGIANSRLPHGELNYDQNEGIHFSI